MRVAGGLAVVLILVAAFVADPTAAQSLSGRRAAAKLLANSSIAGITEGIRAGRFTCVDVISEQLRRIDAYGSKLKAFISVNRDSALALARNKDQTGIAGSLHCVPVAVKDNIDLQGVPTTSGSQALKSMSAAQDSAVVLRIKQMGGIVIGKTNMAEMADSGTKSVSALGGVCANPWDTRRSCLGSSGGSGAAVAAGLAVIGIGTDTEGSIIGPCSAAGLFCMRPTQGQIFEAMGAGVYPAFQRQDLVGIMAKSRADYLTAHDAIYAVDYLHTVGNVTKLNGVKIRFLDNFLESFPLGSLGTYTPDPEMVRLHNLTASRLAGLGAEVERYRTGLADLAGKFQTILTATASKPGCSNSCMKKSLDAYLLRYASTGPFRTARDLLSVIWGFPTSYQEKLNFTLGQADADVCGSTACAAYDTARRTITGILQELLGNATALAVPFTAKLPQLNTEDPGTADQITPALNPYTGWPSVSLPIGFSTSAGADQPQGLPVSLVLLATDGGEPQLLTIASAYLNSFADVRTPTLTPEVTVDGASAAAASVGLVLIACLATVSRSLIEF